jgi:hypothetical protein
VAANAAIRSGASRTVKCSASSSSHILQYSDPATFGADLLAALQYLFILLRLRSMFNSRSSPKTSPPPATPSPQMCYSDPATC